MRTEREQFIKSSSNHSTESQFCLLSTMIFSYLKVMSYGTFTLGNMMSSIIMFHMIVFLVNIYVDDQRNRLHSQGPGRRTESIRATWKRELFLIHQNTMKNSDECHLNLFMPFSLAYITGTKAPNCHLVAILLSHTERPKYKEVIKIAIFFSQDLAVSLFLQFCIEGC